MRFFPSSPKTTLILPEDGQSFWDTLGQDKESVRNHQWSRTHEQTVNWGGRQVFKPDDWIAGFTCPKCPQPTRNTQDFDDEGNLTWVNTARCSTCNQAMLKNRRYRDWFQKIWMMSMKYNSSIYFATLTRSTAHLRSDDPFELNARALDFMKQLKADCSKMIRKNPIWSPYKHCLLVCELVWRRPGDPVYAKEPWTRSRNNPFNLACFQGKVLRQAEQYEAHPHVHVVGLNPPCESGSMKPRKMPYKNLMDAADINDIGCYFEIVQPWRVSKYLRKYLHKNDPTDTNGKRVRSREQFGEVRKFQFKK